MNIFHKIRLFTASLFSGLKNADEIIVGQSSNGDSKVLPIQQVKDNQRVAHHLLKGEVTQEVKELRYRDYLVSENSRNYQVEGDSAIKGSKPSFIVYKFNALNHEICAGMQDEKETYTLKFTYDDVPRFDLSKYCTHFHVDLNKKKILLYFNLRPNKDITTNKAFINYIQSSMTSLKMGGDFNHLVNMWFVSYKITSLQNYLKFTFNDLILNSITNTEKEFILGYNIAGNYTIENLIEKYKVEELEEKYKNKEKKNLPVSDIEYDITLKCEKCGKTITEREAMLNYATCGVKCCYDCVYDEMLTKQ